MATYRELQAQAAALLAQAEQLRVEETLKVMAGIAKTLEEHGLTTQDLLAHFRNRANRATQKPVDKRSAPAPKYRDPVTGATWTGRGRAPVWLRTHIDQGKDREQFLV